MISVKRGRTRAGARVHRGVLDERDGLGLAARAEEQAEAGLAQLPDRLLLGRVGGDVRGVAEAPAGPPRLQIRDLGLDLLLGLPRVLHDQDGGGVALHEPHARGLLDVVAGEVEDHLVGELDRVRARFENGLGGLERLLHVVVVDHVDRGGRGLLHQAHLRLDHGEEGALRADDEPRHVERPVLDQLVQVVAADAAPVPDTRVRIRRRTASGSDRSPGRSDPPGPAHASWPRTARASPPRTPRGCRRPGSWSARSRARR